MTRFHRNAENLAGCYHLTGCIGHLRKYGLCMSHIHRSSSPGWQDFANLGGIITLVSQIIVQMHRRRISNHGPDGGISDLYCLFTYYNRVLLPSVFI